MAKKGLQQVVVLTKDLGSSPRWEPRECPATQAGAEQAGPFRGTHIPALTAFASPPLPSHTDTWVQMPGLGGGQQGFAKLIIVIILGKVAHQHGTTFQR